MVVDTLIIDSTTVFFYDDYIEDNELIEKEVETVVENLIQKI